MQEKNTKERHAHAILHDLLLLTHPADKIVLVFCPASLVGGATSPIQIPVLKIPEDKGFKSPGIDAANMPLSTTVSRSIGPQACKVLVPKYVVRYSVRVVIKDAE